jgi:cytochrome c1
MPTTKQVIEFGFHEFERLAIEALDLMPDYSVVASEEWGNDSDHLFTVDPVDKLLKHERDELDEIYEAAADYRAAVAANGGVDPYARFDTDRKDSESVRAARKRLFKALDWSTRLVFIGLVEQGKITPGEYNISVCW